MEDRPAALVHRLLRRAPRDQRAPVSRLDLDVEAQLLQHVRGQQRLRMDDRLIGRRDDDDLLAVVAGFLDELLRLVEVALSLHRLRAHFARQRRAASEIRIARVAVLLVTGDADDIVVLVDGVEHRLTHLRVVERRIHEIEADQPHRAERIDVLDLDVLVLGQYRDQVGRHLLPPVDFSRVDRRRGGCRIRDVDPLDAVDLHDFAARRPRRRLLARHVVGVLHVDHLASRHPLLLHELEGTGADRLGDVRGRVGLGDALGHDERHVRRRLRERFERERKRPLELERKGLVVDGLPGVRHFRHLLAERVALRPALDDAMQSAARTGWPSWNLRPSRSVKVYVSLSALSSYLSTICGWT